jgi:hypothetical protein
LQIDFIEARVKAQKHMHKNQGVAVVNILLWEWKRNTYVMDYAFHNSTILMYTIFARNYGTATVISYNLKGIAPPSPSSMLRQQKSGVWMHGANIETGRGGRVEKMYQEMVCYNRMHVKTRLSQSILSKIVCWSNTITLTFNL